MAFSYNPNDPKTKEFLAKIGEIVVTLNVLEDHVSFSIWELLNVAGTASEKQVIGKLVTTKLEFMSKVDLLRSLIVHRLGEEKDQEFKITYKLLQQSAQIRNDIAHSMWFIQYGSGKGQLSTQKINEMQAFERGKKMDFAKSIATIDITDFDKYLDIMESAQRELFSFINKSLYKSSEK